MPTAATPLRFRYTSYLGEEHPAAKKVVMEFQPSQLPNLTEPQRNKLIKLLGVRYDPLKDMAKMACERYPTAPQNKNDLVQTIERLLKECREGEDLMQDIPFDFRHARFRKKEKAVFPEEWKMNARRRMELDMTWEFENDLDQQREVQGLIVDGRKEIGVPEELLEETQPELVVATRKRTS